MGQVTGVWPTLTDSPERKKLASSKNLGFVMFCTTRPPSHPKTRGESIGDFFLIFYPLEFSSYSYQRMRSGVRADREGGGVQGLKGGEERPQMSTSRQTRGPDTEAGQHRSSSCSY